MYAVPIVVLLGLEGKIKGWNCIGELVVLVGENEIETYIQTEERDKSYVRGETYTHMAGTHMHEFIIEL